eukprot:gene3482-2433_t
MNHKLHKNNQTNNPHKIKSYTKPTKTPNLPLNPTKALTSQPHPELLYKETYIPGHKQNHNTKQPYVQNATITKLILKVPTISNETHKSQHNAFSTATKQNLINTHYTTTHVHHSPTLNSRLATLNHKHPIRFPTIINARNTLARPTPINYHHHHNQSRRYERTTIKLHAKSNTQHINPENSNSSITLKLTANNPPNTTNLLFLYYTNNKSNSITPTQQALTAKFINARPHITNHATVSPASATTTNTKPPQNSTRNRNQICNPKQRNAQINHLPSTLILHQSPASPTPGSLHRTKAQIASSSYRPPNVQAIRTTLKSQGLTSQTQTHHPDQPSTGCNQQTQNHRILFNHRNSYNYLAASQTPHTLAHHGTYKTQPIHVIPVPITSETHVANNNTTHNYTNTAPALTPDISMLYYINPPPSYLRKAPQIHPKNQQTTHTCYGTFPPYATIRPQTLPPQNPVSYGDSQKHGKNHQKTHLKQGYHLLLGKHKIPAKSHPKRPKYRIRATLNTPQRNRKLCLHKPGKHPPSKHHSNPTKAASQESSQNIGSKPTYTLNQVTCLHNNPQSHQTPKTACIAHDKQLHHNGCQQSNLIIKALNQQKQKTNSNRNNPSLRSSTHHPQNTYKQASPDNPLTIKHNQIKQTQQTKTHHTSSKQQYTIPVISQVTPAETPANCVYAAEHQESTYHKPSLKRNTLKSANPQQTPMTGTPLFHNAMLNLCRNLKFHQSNHTSKHNNPQTIRYHKWHNSMQIANLNPHPKVACPRHNVQPAALTESYKHKYSNTTQKQSLSNHKYKTQCTQTINPTNLLASNSKVIYTTTHDNTKVELLYSSQSTKSSSPAKISSNLKFSTKTSNKLMGKTLYPTQNIQSNQIKYVPTIYSMSKYIHTQTTNQTIKHTAVLAQYKATAPLRAQTNSPTTNITAQHLTRKENPCQQNLCSQHATNASTNPNATPVNKQLGATPAPTNNTDNNNMSKHHKSQRSNNQLHTTIINKPSSSSKPTTLNNSQTNQYAKPSKNSTPLILIRLSNSQQCITKQLTDIVITRENTNPAHNQQNLQETVTTMTHQIIMRN